MDSSSSDDEEPIIANAITLKRKRINIQSEEKDDEEPIIDQSESSNHPKSIIQSPKTKKPRHDHSSMTSTSICTALSSPSTALSSPSTALSPPIPPSISISLLDNTTNTINTTNTTMSTIDNINRSNRKADRTRERRKHIPQKKKKKKRRKRTKKKKKSQKKTDAISIDISTASTPRISKPKMKTNKGRATNEFAHESKAEKWLSNIKNASNYDGEFVNCELEAASTRSDAPVDKNYYCKCCELWLKACQERAMTSHLVSRNHINNKKANEKKGMKQPKFKTYVAICSQILFDWMFDALKFNISGKAMTGMANSFMQKYCRPSVRNHIPKHASVFSSSVDFMTQCMNKQISYIVAERKSHRYWHWSFLADEGEGNHYGVMIAHTAFDCRSKPLLSTAKVLEASSNSVGVQKTFMDNIYKHQLDADHARLILLDGVSYNMTSLVGIFALCPFMHLIKCPLHSGCNAQAEGI